MRPDWAYMRPSTTVVGTFRPEVIAGPGFRKAGDGPRQSAAGSVTTTVDERKALCGFPASHEFHGAKGKIDLQLGNCVPPPVASAVLRHLWGAA